MSVIVYMLIYFPLFKSDDSLILVELRKLTAIMITNTTSGMVIDPVEDDLKLSIPKIKSIPEICPASNRNPFDVPSETG
jgi:hypothetical protein